MNEPDINELRATLDKYGGSDLRIPWMGNLGTKYAPVYQAEIHVTLAWNGDWNKEPIDARQMKHWYLDRIAALEDELKTIGWLLQGRIYVNFQSEKRSPRFYINRGLFEEGVEDCVGAEVQCSLLWYDRSKTKERAS